MLCLVLCLAGTAGVYARGQSESQLAEAERLIEQQDYTAALKLLAIVQRDNPDLRDETARLMTKIMTVTQQYNAVQVELLAARDSGDVAAMQRYLLELEKIDPKRSKEVLKTAGVMVGLMRLMNNTEPLLAQLSIKEALTQYLLPLTDPDKANIVLPVKEFQASGYGSIIVTEVEQEVAGIRAAVTRELGAIDGIAAVSGALGSLIDGPASPGMADSFDTITAPLLQAATVEGSVRAASLSLMEIGGGIRDAKENGKEDPYLQYLAVLFLGRENKDEGIVAALRLLWEKTAREAAAAALDRASRSFEAARVLYADGQFDRAGPGFVDAGYRGILAVKAAVLASAALQTSASTGWALAADQKPAAERLLAQASTAQEQVAEAGAYRELIRFKKDLETLPVVEPAVAPAAGEAPALLAARSAIAARVGELVILRDEWRTSAAAWRRKAEAGAAPSTQAESADGMADRFEALAGTDLQQRDLAYALRIAAIGGSGFPQRLASAVAVRKRGEAAAAGVADSQSGAASTEKHPEIAVQDYQSAAADLDALIADVEALMAGLRAEKPYVTASPGYTALLKGSGGAEGYEGLLAAAHTERSGLDALSTAVQKQMDDAAIASSQGDIDYAQALAAYSQNDPDSASRFLDSARTAYLLSLQSAHTAHAAARVGTDLNDLDVKIQALNRKIAIDNAQKAITAINRKIAAKDYLGASDDLDTAERAWNETGQGTYPSFDLLRQNIQNALDLSQGRDLSRLDPKAAVVTAFMNNAQAALEAGRLEDAASNVRDALAVAPNYGAAKVLKLRIQKQTDPVGFQKEAAAQIAMYMKMALDSTNTQGQKDAYLALLDYSRLDPKFEAQTKATIQELEYQLNLVRRPATPQQVAQSNALVQEASRLSQEGTQDAYTRALEKIKQALQANPDNRAAIVLDAQVRTKISGIAITALSSADALVYNEAYSEFLSGAYQDAYDKVGTLWKSARNQTYAPLQKLKKRCEVALNIS
jgi:hypothetical protein